MEPETQTDGPVLIIPDPHEKIDTLRHIIKSYEGKVSHTVILGDYFDSFEHAHDLGPCAEMAQLVKELLWDPDYTLLLGNHDASYRWCGPFVCSGFREKKYERIHGILSWDDWSQFKLYTRVGKWLLSHAGFHKRVLHPTHGSAEEGLRPLAAVAVVMAKAGIVHPLLGCGWSRGGDLPVGGVTWLDWRVEFEPIPGVNQIVGHTRTKQPSRREGDAYDQWSDSDNWNLDTDLRHVALIHKDSFEIRPV